MRLTCEPSSPIDTQPETHNPQPAICNLEPQTLYILTPEPSTPNPDALPQTPNPKPWIPNPKPEPHTPPPRSPPPNFKLCTRWYHSQTTATPRSDRSSTPDGQSSLSLSLPLSLSLSADKHCRTGCEPPYICFNKQVASPPYKCPLARSSCHDRVQEGVAKSQFPLKDSGFQRSNRAFAGFEGF